MIKKEKLKNVTLVILILISICLFSNMWLGEKLWSDGYDFFAFFDVFSLVGDENSSTFAIGDIVTPRRFVISGGDKRNIVSASDSEYSRCVSEIYAVFKHTDGNFSSAAFNEWTSKLKSKSVLIDFGIPVTTQLLAETGITAPDNGLYSKILIVPDDSVLKRCTIYFENSVSGEIFKCLTDNQPAVSALISNFTEGSGAINIPYAFELGFDSVKQEQSGEINQSVLLDSTISLGLSERLVPGAEIKGAFNRQDTDKVLKNFFDTGVSVRRYIEKDGSGVFVNRKSTLKLSSGGYIEYTAESEGKKVTDTRSTDAESVSAVMSLVRSISAQYNLSGLKFQLHNSPSTDDTGATVISLNYLLGSVPLSLKDPSGGATPAATAKIKNGRLVYFKFYICNISQTRQQTVLPSMIKAIDSLYSQAGGEKLRVSDLYVSYIADDVSKTVKPFWCAKIKNSDRVIIINGE